MVKSCDHDFFMKRCFELACLGKGKVSPNPLVGAVIVQENKIVAEGYHAIWGGPHAEAHAIKDALNKRIDLSHATLYCNLEPCCHTKKKTPPCTKAILENKIPKVYFANFDPNPLVSGQGLKQLQSHGVEVHAGILENEGKVLNQIYFKNATDQLPFVHLKMAMSLDGKVALSSGDSKWISSNKQRMRVHQLRYEYDAVVVGRKTFTTDNPSLTSRDCPAYPFKIPYRLVVGDAFKFQNLQDHSQYIMMQSNTDKNIFINFNQNQPLKSIDGFGHVLNCRDIQEMLSKLYKLNICSILVEGGAQLFSSFVTLGLYDLIELHVAPVFLGNGVAVYQNKAIDQMSKAIRPGASTYSFDDGYLTIQITPEIK